MKIDAKPISSDEWLRRHISPTPFETALMKGASVSEATAIAAKEGGGISVRRFFWDQCVAPLKMYAR